MRKITIEAGNIVLEAELNETTTAEIIYNSLPLEGSAIIWGEEIYFGTGIGVKEEPTAIEEVELGTLAYWPVGAAFCIFFGPTPVSTGNKPRAYSPVNVFGKIKGNAKLLKSVRQGENVVVKPVL